MTLACWVNGVRTVIIDPVENIVDEDKVVNESTSNIQAIQWSLNDLIEVLEDFIVIPKYSTIVVDTIDLTDDGDIIVDLPICDLMPHKHTTTLIVHYFVYPYDLEENITPKLEIQILPHIILMKQH